MDAKNQILLSILLVCLGTSHGAGHHQSTHMPQHEHGSELSFAGLKMAGCLPRDFKDPHFESCLEDGHSDGPAVYKALSCVAQKYNISTEDRDDGLHHMYDLIDTMTERLLWREKQKDFVHLCHHMEKNWAGSTMKTAEEHGAFMVLCWRRTLDYHCGLRTMMSLGPRYARTGHDLLQRDDGRCHNEVTDLEHDEAFHNCSHGTDFDWMHISQGEHWASKYIQAAESGEPLKPLRHEELDSLEYQLRLLREAKVCTMKRTGQADPNGIVNYDRVIQIATASEKNKEALLLEIGLAKHCKHYHRDSTTANELLHCLEAYSPYVCIVLHGEHMVKRRGEGVRGYRTVVADEVGFSGLKAAGCLPRDFVEQDLMRCVDPGSHGGSALHATLVCVAETYGILSIQHDEVHPDALGDAFAKMTSDKHWLERQKNHTEECLQHIDKTALKTEVNEAVFLLVCTRKMEKKQCHHHIFSEMHHADMVAPLAQKLLSMHDRKCLHQVKNPKCEAAWSKCSKETGLNMKMLSDGIEWAEHYTNQVHAGIVGDQLPILTQYEVARLEKQLHLYEKTRSCKRSAVHEVRDDHSVDYSVVHDQLKQAQGGRLIMSLIGGVVKHCEKSVNLEEEYVGCWDDGAEDACLYLFAHELATKGHHGGCR